MIIAHIPLPAIKIPRHIRAKARGGSIEVDSCNVPFGANSWLMCGHAWPHTDPDWSDKYFFNLSLVADHMLGDATCSMDCYEQHVQPGDLSVIDPRVVHWLSPSWDEKRSFVSVQWEVPRRSAKRMAQKIVRELNGIWRETIERRYASWRPA